jgi:hypothetical protein
MSGVFERRTELIRTFSARRLIKPVYIRQLVQLIDRIRAERRDR